VTGTAQRRARGATESLLTVVLILEALVVFFLTMTAFGLKVVEPAVAFGGGAVLVALLVLATRVLRYPRGVWLGWVLQVALLATGLVLPAMFFIAAGFAAIWTYCLVKGGQLDVARSAYLSETSALEKETP
jgi:hypothetical protein